MPGELARRLNNEISGYRSLVAKTARAMPLEGEAKPLLIALDAALGRTAVLAGHRQERQPHSPFFCWLRSTCSRTTSAASTRRRPINDLPRHLLPHALDRRAHHRHRAADRLSAGLLGVDPARAQANLVMIWC
jgi:hypothetical protein